MKRNTKLIMALSAGIISLCIVGTSAYAIFTGIKADDTSLTAGDINITVYEENRQGEDTYAATMSGEDLWISGDTTVKSVRYTVVSDGSKRSYLRAQVIPIIQNYVDGEWITANDVAVSDFATYVSTGNDARNDSWIYSDGYYYFPNVVGSGDNISVYIGSNAPIDEDTRVIYDVDFQASQATHNAYAKNWNIKGLPAGVEVLKSAY